MSIQVKNNVKWVGIKDWETEYFHGTEYKMGRGTSYNSYLIQEEKTILIDTVDHQFDEQFIANLEQEIDLNQIDYIITQHAEHDHAGALSTLMAKIPNTPIYCTELALTASLVITTSQTGISEWSRRVTHLILVTAKHLSLLR